MAGGEPLRPGDPAEVGGYRLLRRLGSDGQGVVYLGEGPAGRVAVKVLRADGVDARARAYLAREIEAARRVAPFCVARIVDADPLGDSPYLVSEYVDGPSLAEVGPRSGADLQRLAVATATALAAVHEAGIVHRDFKPANVLLGPDGARVIDFGIAKSLADSLTLTSQIVGTPSFMAPEQLAGEPVGPAADVFAWGGVILYAATGRAPFGSDTLPAVMHRILTADPDLSALEEPLRSIVAAALAKTSATRPTMIEICLRLLGRPVENVSIQQVTTPKPSTPPTPHPHPQADAPTGPEALLPGSGAGAGSDPRPAPDDRPASSVPRGASGHPNAPALPGAASGPGMGASSVAEHVGAASGAGPTARPDASLPIPDASPALFGPSTPQPPHVAAAGASPASFGAAAPQPGAVGAFGGPVGAGTAGVPAELGNAAESGLVAGAGKGGSRRGGVAGDSEATVPPGGRKVLRRVVVGGAAVAVAAAAAIAAIVIPHGATAVQPTPNPGTATAAISTSPSQSPISAISTSQSKAPTSGPGTPTTAPRTPVAAPRTFPRAFQGTWQGTVSYDPGASDRLRLEVGPDGITEHYIQYRCTATSRLTAVKGDTATLKRAAMKGNCPRNGSITLELDPAGRTLVFRYTGHGENAVTRNIRFTMYALLERSG
ncbi:serine/threonine protein kinase [Nonomuraea sp. NPDC050536]|uniref:serine/threonine protein kinase n=1 Tax=Nonomuraea sp. NPDC050536 TaxID=3364366 RepID=UPI0037C5D28B